jgi:hypothetical protein
MKLALTLFLAAASLLTAEPAAQLWDERAPLLKAMELPVLQDARFSVIKPYEFNKDGYRFLHGVALCFHKGRLYAANVFVKLLVVFVRNLEHGLCRALNEEPVPPQRDWPSKLKPCH